MALPRQAHRRRVGGICVLETLITKLARTVVPVHGRDWIRAQQRRHRLQWPRSGRVQFEGLRRTTPVSRVFGIDRGLPIDRYYIERFLATHSSDIQGRVLEMGDPYYTKKFGGDRVDESDVLHVVEGNPAATVIADLTCADHVASDSFDCIICTQTLQMIYDTRAALGHLHRILKPGGTLLATASGISKVARREGVDDWGEYWHFTSQGMAALLQEVMPDAYIEVGTAGNVLSSIAYLHGLATEELSRQELDAHDRDFELVVTARVVKN